MISGRDFLTLAQVWSRGRSEAEWRCAVSRAYYAAFHECRQLLGELGFVVPRADLAHAYLWLRLSNSQVVELVDAGSELNTLRRERNRADYDLHLTTTASTAMTATVSVSRIISVIDQLTDENRQRATQAIRDYERDVLHETTWRRRPR